MINKFCFNFLLLFLMAPVKHCLSQDSSFSVGVKVSEFIFNDFSLYIEKRDLGKFVGISCGYMISNRWWEFEVNDNLFPIGAYNGPVVRFYFGKIKPKKTITLRQLKSKGLNKNKLIGHEFLLKYLYYNNYKFRDYKVINHSDHYVEYTRNEDAILIGYSYLFGNEIQKRNLLFQLICGLGGRLKFRKTNTTSNYSDYGDPNSYRPLGIKKSILIFPTLNLGIKINYLQKYK